MPRRLSLLPLLFALVLLAPPGTARQPEGKKSLISIEDLYRLDGPRSPVLSPDGKSLVYVRSWVADRKTERHSLWRTENAGGRGAALEEGEPDGRAPVLSPDGRWVAFVSTRPRPAGWRQTPPVHPSSDPAADVWLVPSSGGKAIPLAGPKREHGRVFHDGFYGRLAFSPDGKKLAFVADDGKDSRTKEERENDVVVVREDQGEGYTGYRPAQLWVAHLDEKPEKFAASRITRLTNDEVWYGDPDWTPDGKTLVVHANRTAERESVRYSINRNYDLWAVDVASGKLRQLTRGPGPEVSPRVSPDGKTVACLSVPRRGSHRDVFNLALVSLDGEEPAARLLFDHHKPDAGSPPHPAPSFPLPDECWDGEHHLLCTAERGVRTETVRIDVRTGKGAAVPSDKKAAEELTGAAARIRQRARLTPPGNPLLKDRQLGRSEVIRWKSADGLAMDGILTLPPKGAGNAPHPLVVHPHGGPHSRSALGFDFTVQVLAANGYAVFQPNFRGSSGYGQKFIDADRLDLGGGDMRDVLSGVDHLVKEKVADGGRLFVYGTSYGGFMTTWLVGQTDRFRAAVAQNAVTDMNMMWALTDIQTWTEWELGGLPWEVPERMRKHSPLTHVTRVKTPTLILHSRDDRRVPLPLGLAFYQALRARKVPAAMVIYPDEGHGIRQPRHREDVLRRVLDWFAKHGRTGK